MTLYQFKLLDENDQAEVTWEKGILLDARIDGTLSMLLYRIDNFYVEIQYDQDINEIIGIKSFISDRLLEPYLDKINLVELLNSDIIVNYQTALYEAIFLNKKIGWDYGEVYYESELFNNPSGAMVAFNENHFTLKHWIATLRVIKNGEIVEEEMFDSNVYTEA